MGLSVGWDCRGRGGEKGRGAPAHNSQHICAPLSSILNIPSRPVLRHPPQRPVLDSLSYTGPAIFSACISKAPTFPAFLLANIFHRQTACSECFEKSTVCFWRASPQDVLLQSEESCRCTLQFSIYFPGMSVVVSSPSTECLDLVHVAHKTKYVQNVHGVA